MKTVTVIASSPAKGGYKKEGTDRFYCKGPKHHDFVRNFGYAMIMLSAVRKVDLHGKQYKNGRPHPIGQIRA